MAIDGTQATPSSIGAALRETLVEKFAEVEERDGPRNPPPEPPAPAAETSEAAAPAGETAEQKAGRTAGRPRDEKGRLLPGKAAQVAEPQAQKPDAGASTVAAQPAPAVPAPAAAPAAPIPRPNSWKKDYHEAFDKLAVENPALAAYINQREIEQSRGIAQHAERYAAVKPLMDAVTPYLADMQKHGIEPTQMVGNLLNAHRTLAMGDPQTKVGLFQKLLSDYGIQAQLAVQGQDGQWQLLAAQPYNPPQQQQQPPNIDAIVEQKLTERDMQRQIQEFTGNTEKHPHYEEVRETMAGLLQAGLADDLESAYEAALLHPRHRDLLAAQQSAQREEEEAARRAAEQQRVAGARAKAVSTPTATPGGPATAVGKSLRESIAAKVYAAQGGGRV